MNHAEDEFSCLKDSVRAASSMRFGISCSKLELSFFALFGVLVAGLVFYLSRACPPVIRMSAMVGAAVCMLSVLSVYRMSAPFCLGISYADMLRMRWPFGIWTCCVFLIVCTSDSFIALFSNPQMSTVFSGLSILAVGQGVEYFRKGHVRHSLASCLLAGVTVGLSAFGLCTLALVVIVSFLFRWRLRVQLEMENASVDESAMRILERSDDPSMKTMDRMIAAFCFLAGFLVVVAGKLMKTGSLSEIFGHEWMSGLSTSGVAVVVAVGVMPLIFALCGIGNATDTMKPFGIVNQLKYVLVACMGIVFLFFGEKVFAVLCVFTGADSSYWLLGVVLGGFALLTAVSVALVDVWCRMTSFVRMYKAKKSESTFWFCRLFFLVLPFVLVLVAFGIRFHSRSF